VGAFGASAVEDATLAWLKYFAWTVKRRFAVSHGGYALTLTICQRKRQKYSIESCGQLCTFHLAERQGCN